MKKYIIFFLILFTIAPIKAQCLLEGTIIDEQSCNIPYVSVRLLNKDSIFIKGTTTDSIGKYTFTDIPIGHFIISHSCIGYKTQYVSIDLKSQYLQTLAITLQTDNIALNEVTVKASSFVRQKDRLLILPNKQQIKHAGTGYDLLYNLMIPGVNVDRQSGKVSALNGEVTLYIDGRKVDYREVQSLRPQDIEKVEFHDAPTGKYSGDIASINYITKQYKTGGYVSLDAKQTIGYLNGDYNIVAKFSHKQTNYTLFAGYNMQKYGGERERKSENILFPDYYVTRNYTTIDARMKNDAQYAQLNILNQTNKRTLLAKVSFVRNNQPDNRNSKSVEYRGQYNYEQNSYQGSKQKGVMPTLNLYGNFKTGTNQYIETSFTSSYSDNSYNYTYSENNNSIYTTTEEDMYELNTNFNYGIQFKHQNSLNAKLYHFHKISLSTYSGSTNLWQHLWTGETLLFTEYSQRFGKKTSIRIAPGISSLQYKLHGNDRISQIAPRLLFVMTHQPTMKQFIQFSVNVGNSFPTINMLNNVEQTIDFLQVKRGNPNLETTKAYFATGVYSLNLGKINLQAVGMYQFYQDMYVGDYFVENEKLVQSYRTDINWHQIIGMLSLTWKPMNSFQLKVDGTYNFSKFDRGVSKQLGCWSGGAQMNYYWKDFSFNLYGKTENKGLSLEMIEVYMPLSYGVSASWNKNNWRIEAGTENPFSQNIHWKYILNNEVYSYRSLINSKKNQASGYIKVAYTFDFGKNTSRDSKDINTNINSAILKAEY